MERRATQRRLRWYAEFYARNKSDDATATAATTAARRKSYGNPTVEAAQSRSIASLRRDSDASGIWMQLREMQNRKGDGKRERRAKKRVKGAVNAVALRRESTVGIGAITGGRAVSRKPEQYVV